MSSVHTMGQESGLQPRSGRYGGRLVLVAVLASAERDGDGGLALGRLGARGPWGGAGAIADGPELVGVAWG